MYQVAYHKGLDLWNFETKSKIYWFYQDAYHKWLDLWNIGTKSKIYRFYQDAYHKRLDLWNIGTKSKIYRLYQDAYQKGWIFGTFEQNQKFTNSGFLEHFNSQKSLCNIWQYFSCLLDESIEKKCKKKIFHGGLFLKSTLSVLRCTWTGRIIWKKFWDIILTI